MGRRAVHKQKARKSLRPRAPRESGRAPRSSSAETDSPRASVPAPAHSERVRRAPDPEPVPEPYALHESSAAPLPSAVELDMAHDAEHEAMAHTFFSQPPQAWDLDDHLDDTAPPHAGLLRRPRAMLVTVSILAVSLAVLAVFLVFQSVIPEPVELGVVGSVALPTAAPVKLAPGSVPVRVQAPDVHLPPPAAAVAARPVVVTSPTPVPSFEDLIAAGHALSQTGQHAAAVDAYRQALRLRADSALALAPLANVELNAGDTAAAKRDAARALIAAPTSSEAWIVLGAAEDALGDHAASRIAYRKCVALGVGGYVRECQQLAR